MKLHVKLNFYQLWVFTSDLVQIIGLDILEYIIHEVNTFSLNGYFMAKQEYITNSIFLQYEFNIDGKYCDIYSI